MLLYKIRAQQVVGILIAHLNPVISIIAALRHACISTYIIYIRHLEVFIRALRHILIIEDHTAQKCQRHQLIKGIAGILLCQIISALRRRQQILRADSWAHEPLRANAIAQLCLIRQAS